MYPKILQFPAFKKLKILSSFNGGLITSDAGILLLRQVEKKTKLLERVAATISDDRKKEKITHSIVSMVKQRVFAIATGYEDLNDHKTLRHDIEFQVAANSSAALASSPLVLVLDAFEAVLRLLFVI